MDGFGFRADFVTPQPALPWDSGDFEIVGLEDVPGFDFTSLDL